MEEVPDEITLAFNISGCPHHCDGCHSQNLWQYKGDILSEDIDSIIQQYKDYITCVCFMGGDQNMDELYLLCRNIKNIYNKKVCIYSGEDTLDKFKGLILCEYLDYIKIGRYNKNLGGLNCKTTNQKMYEIRNNGLWDITWKFQRIKEETISDNQYAEKIS